MVSPSSVAVPILDASSAWTSPDSKPTPTPSPNASSNPSPNSSLPIKLRTLKIPVHRPRAQNGNLILNPRIELLGTYDEQGVYQEFENPQIVIPHVVADDAKAQKIDKVAGRALHGPDKYIVKALGEFENRTFLSLVKNSEEGDIYLFDEIQRLLVNCDLIDINELDKKGNTCLHLLLNEQLCNRKVIELLLENGADPAIKNDKNQTPFSIFVAHRTYWEINDFYEVLKIFISKEIEIPKDLMVDLKKIKDKRVVELLKKYRRCCCIIC